MTNRIVRNFKSGDAICAGTLYLPDGVSRPPVLVMAHGFGAERAWGLPSLADRLAAAGFASFLFDYRGFGDSSGSPRRVVSIRRQRQDFVTATRHVRTFREIDPQRLVLWGTSFSGGHVLTLAARGAPCAGVIAHVPHVDPLASLKAKEGPRSIPLKLLGAAVRDSFRMVTFREPYYIAAVGGPNEVAVVGAEDAIAGVTALIPPGAPFDNRCAARIGLTLPFFRPIREVSRIRVPTLLIAAVQDSVIPINAVRKAAARVPDSYVVELDCGHFASYAGPWFERSIAAQIDFLRERIEQSGRPRASQG